MKLDLASEACPGFSTNLVQSKISARLVPCLLHKDPQCVVLHKRQEVDVDYSGAAIISDLAVWNIFKGHLLH